MADRIGEHFGNYRLVRLLGQGGFAEVYLGQHLRLNQQASIKVLHSHLTQTEAEHFQQEAQIISTFVHPSIIRVFDYDVQDGVPFLVMDYAQGGSLRKLHPKGSPLRLPQIVAYVKQVAAPCSTPTGRSLSTVASSPRTLRSRSRNRSFTWRKSWPVRANICCYIRSVHQYVGENIVFISERKG